MKNWSKNLFCNQIAIDFSFDINSEDIWIQLRVRNATKLRVIENMWNIEIDFSKLQIQFEINFEHKSRVDFN